MQEANKLSPSFACHGQHNLQEKDNLPLGDSHHIQKASKGLDIAHVYHLCESLNIRNAIKYTLVAHTRSETNKLQGQHYSISSITIKVTTPG